MGGEQRIRKSPYLIKRIECCRRLRIEKEKVHILQHNGIRVKEDHFLVLRQMPKFEL